ncbi:MAG TPA: LysR family transcriptional regulator [Microvirga sp.]|jgi:DNA-binding transcriptional LysR family regulator|nr:LysR family transcriptional regulator [Microvirga sp.]
MTSNLHGIPEFAAVAEAGGFSAAGRRLGLSKSLVSERVSALEERLGTRLLVRTTRRVALTEAGEAYLDHAQRILAEAAAGEAAIQEIGASPRGRLRVSTSIGVAVGTLAPLLSDFHDRYPHVAVEVLSDDRVVDLVAERVDVALRATVPANPGEIARSLAPIHYRICAAPAYLARRGRPEHPSDLARHRCILYGEGTRWNEWHFVRGTEAASVRVSGMLRSHSPTMTQAAVAAGAGIGLVMSLADPGARPRGGAMREGLVDLFPDWQLVGYEGRNLWAIYPDNRRIPPKVRVFVDFVAGRLRP